MTDSTTPRPNILFIVPEDLGPQLGCYGDPVARTPRIDALARAGVCFTNASVPYSICSPSRACCLTGLYPQQNGHLGLATHNFEYYRPDTPNLVTRLQTAGYRTGIIGKLHVNPESAFPFDFTSLMHEANFKREVPMETYVNSARQFWRESDGQPWFLTVNFPDAHLPFVRQADGRPARLHNPDDVRLPSWVGVDSPRLREITADYYNCIARVDEWTGALLDALDAAGLADNTLVCFICDHGPQFARGKGTVYQAALHVPFIMRGPGVTVGTVRDELVANVDLAPTVLTAAGLPLDDEFLGRSLQPLLAAAPAPDWPQEQFAVTTGSFPYNCFISESVRCGRWKLIWTPPQTGPNPIAGSYLHNGTERPFRVITALQTDEYAALPPAVAAAYARWENPPVYELYDLENDPDEWHDLAGDPRHAAIRDQLVARLQNFQRATRDPFADAANREAFIAEQQDYRDGRYQDVPDFKWAYVKRFRCWRENADI
ncbi:MAG: sulfatase [Opitutaceae bacterium]|nr:sulfatase [Cephaloticoccus sp.]MCP5530822.1 sulfatase [Opitutaceae bacterium]